MKVWKQKSIILHSNDRFFWFSGFQSMAVKNIPKPEEISEKLGQGLNSKILMYQGQRQSTLQHLFSPEDTTTIVMI